MLVFLAAVIILLAAIPSSVSARGNHFRYDPVRTYRMTTSNSCGSHGNQYQNRGFNRRGTGLSIGGSINYEKNTISSDGKSQKTIRISFGIGLSKR
ncbi:MAG: hypothetical protein WCX12_02690 [Candidatus Paceibacterota bacterium]